MYGPLLSPTPREGADVTLTLRTDAPVDDATLASVSLLRRHVVAEPFLAAMRSVLAGAAGAPPMALRLRPSETTYVMPRGGDRLSIIVSLDFAETMDRAMARVVAQELVEAGRHVTGAPSVIFTDRDAPPPLELRGLGAGAVPARASDASFVGYLTLSLLPRHFDTAAKADAAATQLALLRTYLGYHIKAAKSALHARMRGRVDGWLAALQRAAPGAADGAFEGPGGGAAKKAVVGASGRTFVRK